MEKKTSVCFFGCQDVDHISNQMAHVLLQRGLKPGQAKRVDGDGDGMCVFFPCLCGGHILD